MYNQRCVSRCVDDVVLRARWNHDRAAVARGVALSASAVGLHLAKLTNNLRHLARLASHG